MFKNVRSPFAVLCLWCLLVVVASFSLSANATITPTPVTGCNAIPPQYTTASCTTYTGSGWSQSLWVGPTPTCSLDCVYTNPAYTWSANGFHAPITSLGSVTTQTCPSGSTLSGGSCVCNAPLIENAANNGCEAPPAPNYCGGLVGKSAGPFSGAGSTGTKSLCLLGGSNLDQNLSGDQAKPGCLATGYATAAYGDGNGGFTWSMELKYSGGKCLPNDAGDPNITATGTPAVASCGPGQVAGTVNGTNYCYTPDTSNRPVEKTGSGSSTTTNTDGSTTSTSIDKKVTCSTTNCTTTTTTTTTIKDTSGATVGSPVTKTDISSCTRGSPGCGNLGNTTPTKIDTRTETTKTTGPTVTNPDGTTTVKTSESTTGTNSGSGSGGGNGNGDGSPTDCDIHPDTVGCMKTGIDPGAENLSKSNVNIGATNTASFATGAGCPAPLAFSVIGHSYAVSYQPICDRLAILKALFLVMAAVMSAYIIADGFRV